MTMASTTEKDSWTDYGGVFSFLNFTQAVIKHFTIDTSLTQRCILEIPLIGFI